jgi:hypothetical protein
MGGHPTAAVLAITLDARVSRRWLELLPRLRGRAKPHGVPIVGGDMAEGAGTVSASLTLLGKPSRRRASSPAPARVAAIGFTSRANSAGAALGAPFSRSRPASPRAHGSPATRGPRHDGCQRRPRQRPGRAHPRGELPARPPPRCRFAAAPTCAPPSTDGEDYELVFAVAARTDRAALDAAPGRAGSPAPASPASDASSPPTRSPPTPSTSPTTVATNIYAKLRAGVDNVKLRRRDSDARRRVRRRAPARRHARAPRRSRRRQDHLRPRPRPRLRYSPNHVTSPTFTIFTLHRGATNLLHLDAYRLESARQVEDLLLGRIPGSSLVPGCGVARQDRRLAAAGRTLHLDLGITRARHHTVRLR